MNDDMKNGARLGFIAGIVFSCIVGASLMLLVRFMAVQYKDEIDPARFRSVQEFNRKLLEDQ